MRLLILMIVVAVFGSCTTETKAEKTQIEKETSNVKNLENALWLIGTWEMDEEFGFLREEWKRQNDSVFIGKSYTTKGKDTMVYETIRLVIENNDIYYIPRVMTQNDGEEIRFKAVQFSPNALVFENVAHDFPQRIEYNMLSKDSLIAEISGMIEGKSEAQPFPMKRIANN